jgi:ABC-2 type transport system permease protein
MTHATTSLPRARAERTTAGAWRRICVGAAKYLAFVRVARRELGRQPAELAVRALVYLLLMVVFSRLWNAVGESGMPAGYRRQDVVWYLVMTEWIVLGVPLAYLPIEEEVRRGDVAYALLRPVSYLASTYALALGRLTLRLPFLGLVGFGLGWWLSGGALPNAPAFGRAIALGVLSAMLLTLFYVLIGISSFWLTDVAPVYWVTQKLLFVLGGLMLPLELYPSTLQDIARFTPYPSMLNGPASTLLERGGDVSGLALELGLWSGAVVAISALALTRASRALTLHGG